MIGTPLVGECQFCKHLGRLGRHHLVFNQHEVESYENELTRLRGVLKNELRTMSDVDFTEEVRKRLKYWNRACLIREWGVERMKELLHKGSSAVHDIWFDHLGVKELLDEEWSYAAIRRPIPEEFIRGPKISMTRAQARRAFPPGASQIGDILAATEGGHDEFVMDVEDDHAQHALADMYRIRHMSPILALVGDEGAAKNNNGHAVPTPTNHEKEDGQHNGEDHADNGDEALGENLPLAAANAAIEHYEKVLLPQTVRLWQENGRPRTDRDSNIQMRDYLKRVHTFTTSGDTKQPSVEVYRAIANIAFSLDAANRLWRNHGITDEAYSKLSRDGMQQIARVRDTLDKARVPGLPPLSDSSTKPNTKPRQQKPIQPFVIERSLDSRDGVNAGLYTYDPSRPLGPMISETVQSEMQDRRNGGRAGSMDVEMDLTDYNHVHAVGSGRVGVSTTRTTREEFTGRTLELDQLVEID